MAALLHSEVWCPSQLPPHPLLRGEAPSATEMGKETLALCFTLGRAASRVLGEDALCSLMSFWGPGGLGHLQGQQ